MGRSQLLGTTAASRALVLSSLAIGAAFAAAPAQAKDVYLAAIRACVDATGKNVATCPTGGSASAVPVWSFLTITPAEFAAKLPTTSLTATPPVVPGPLLSADSSSTSGGLVVHLLNTLPVPVSLIIPGQPSALTPVWFDPATGPNGPAAATGSRPAGNTTYRVRSLNTETAPGATGTYTWSNLVPGSFIYESATHQGIQVPMGLHGPLIVASGTTTAGETSGTGYPAYLTNPAVTYTAQVATYLSEIDATMHATVDASPTHDATPAGSAVKVSPIEYWPNIFLTTQQALAPDFTVQPPSGGHSQVSLNTPTLMRFFNASPRSHVQVVQDEYVNVLAEDGSPYRYPKTQYSVLLEAGKTKDALMTPAALETVAVYDRMLNTGGTGATAQGMVAYLDIASPSTPTAKNDSYTTPMGVALTVPAATGVLANDVSHDAQTLTAQLVTTTANGTLALASNGGFTYTPKVGSTATSDAFAYKAAETVSGTAGTTTYLSQQATATITLTASPSPVAKADTYAATATTPLTVAAPGVLGNDTDPPGHGLTATVATNPAHGTLALAANGSFTYTAASGFTGADSFTYTAADGALKSAPATVTINVAAAAPIAANDTFTVSRNSTNNSFNVLQNDPGPYLRGSMAVTTPNSGGTARANAAGTVTYAPKRLFVGTDTFTYKFTNAAGVASNVATVTVTVK